MALLGLLEADHERAQIRQPQPMRHHAAQHAALVAEQGRSPAAPLPVTTRARAWCPGACSRRRKARSARCASSWRMPCRSITASTRLLAAPQLRAQAALQRRQRRRGRLHRSGVGRDGENERRRSQDGGAGGAIGAPARSARRPGSGLTERATCRQSAISASDNVLPRRRISASSARPEHGEIEAHGGSARRDDRPPRPSRRRDRPGRAEDGRAGILRDHQAGQAFRCRPRHPARSHRSRPAGRRARQCGRRRCCAKASAAGRRRRSDLSAAGRSSRRAKKTKERFSRIRSRAKPASAFSRATSLSIVISAGGMLSRSLSTRPSEV